jgi:hypothetical protein
MSDYDERPMTTGGWFWTLLVLAIPLVNLIMYIVWACGAGNRNRVTFCRATILWCVIGIALYVLLIVVAGVGGAALGTLPK